jgi:hypothetical protein
MSSGEHEPLSWLALERYALGELTQRERALVEQRLARSAQDRACLQSILQDQTELPPLPRLSAVEARPVLRRTRRGWTRAGGALAAAAALALALFDRSESPPSRRIVYDGTKGGAVAVMVHGERGGRDATRFADGERFKLLVTCPEWLSAKLHVLVFQDGQRYRPLADGGSFVCGNGVPWPGAFALDGAAPVDVCVTWDVETERRVAARSPEALVPNIVCTRLAPR